MEELYFYVSDAEGGGGAEEGGEKLGETAREGYVGSVWMDFSSAVLLVALLLYVFLRGGRRYRAKSR